jgi:hypothetical protein
VRVASEADARELAELVTSPARVCPVHLRGTCKGQLVSLGGWSTSSKRKGTRRPDRGCGLGDGALPSLTGYPIGPQPEPIGNDFPALFRPLQELENEARESWYVNVLACYPEYLGRGLGSRLLDLAEQIAREEALRRMSVIVANNNAGARRLCMSGMATKNSQHCPM